MSIALPVRRRRPAAKSGRVCRPRERPTSLLPTMVEFLTAPVAILLGASFLSREVRIFGRRLGLRQRAVGSGLAGRDRGEGAGDKRRSDPSAFECQRLGAARHYCPRTSPWIPACEGMTYGRSPASPLTARTLSRSNGLVINLALMSYGRRYPYFREHARGYDRPEHHTRDVRGESGLGPRPIGQAEGRQR